MTYALICWDDCVPTVLVGTQVEVKTIARVGTCAYCRRRNVCCGYVDPKQAPPPEPRQ